MGGPQSLWHVQKVGNPQLLEYFYIWNKVIVHIRLSQKNKQNNYNDNKNKINLIRVCSNCHGHEKLQEWELN
jgi:hypothetical protein